MSTMELSNKSIHYVAVSIQNAIFENMVSLPAFKKLLLDHGILGVKRVLVILNHYDFRESFKSIQYRTIEKKAFIKIHQACNFPRINELANIKNMEFVVYNATPHIERFKLEYFSEELRKLKDHLKDSYIRKQPDYINADWGIQ